MPKDLSYHRAAIQYNEELSSFAAKLAEKLADVNEEVAKWCRAISKQHKFHAGRHKKALDKMESDMDANLETPKDIAGGGGSADPEDLDVPVTALDPDEAESPVGSDLDISKTPEPVDDNSDESQTPTPVDNVPDEAATNE